ncbi:hypothetical protein SVEN_0026 [Streptomyces venezuelae ATCC 10712]|uniref:Uncharacterized protein n=1 Tax=Streptomyces venezuelae (strain ATCC 10712 / CBS 650.69 / DSM 40230 / JCM 4526 / NBRC 13096 / PD 04745) TaxID=953739 RepID=F2R368_STRVP|nr:hypothetical protein SVEN_0026 [Streptomyces venezuelae ATCC 10712]
MAFLLGAVGSPDGSPSVCLILRVRGVVVDYAGGNEGRCALP